MLTLLAHSLKRIISLNNILSSLAIQILSEILCDRKHDKIILSISQRLLAESMKNMGISNPEAEKDLKKFKN